MLYGKPTKHIRHADEDTLVIEPQRFQTLTFWKYNDNGTTRTDGLDLKDSKACPLGSRITKHKVEILVTPETIEPQQIYIGRIKLSFSDVMNHAICGGRFEQASFGDTATENFVAKTNPICPELYPDQSATDAVTFVKSSSETTDTEIGGTGSGYGIQEWKLDDHIKHWINLKKITVFDQRPLIVCLLIAIMPEWENVGKEYPQRSNESMREPSMDCSSSMTHQEELHPQTLRLPST